MSPLQSATEEFVAFAESSSCRCVKCIARDLRIYRVLIFAEACANTLHPDEFARLWSEVARLADECMAAADAAASTKH